MPEARSHKARSTAARSAARSARLLFSDRLADGHMGESEVLHPDVLSALSPAAVPRKSQRYNQRMGMKREPDWFERRGLDPLLKLREAMLGAAAPASPRFLIRVDEFPLAGSFDRRQRRLRGSFERFHDLLTAAGIPYLMAVCPAVSRDYLDPHATGTRRLSDDEVLSLHAMRADGVEFALHGFDHRSRSANARRRSELAGLDRGALDDLLDRGISTLEQVGIDARLAFVPPFNRFDARSYDVLADRFDIVCGGPETVLELGFHQTPLWRGEAAYVPAYAPFYAPAAAVTDAVIRSIEAQQGVWIPIVLHWSWEMADWGGLERLVGVLAGRTHSWSAFRRAAEPVVRAPDLVADVASAPTPAPKPDRATARAPRRTARARS